MHSKPSRLGLLFLIVLLLFIIQGSVFGATFIQDQKLTSGDFTTDTPLNIPDARFSKGLAVSGNWMAVGAPGDNQNQGAVKIYERVSGLWEYRTQLVAPTAQAGSEFGSSVDIYEAGGLLTVIVGAPLFDATHTDQGRAYIYSDTNASASAFSFMSATINPVSAEPNGRFGYAVALYADIAAISEPNDDVTNAGLVSIRGRNISGTNAWGQIANKSGNLGNGFGTSIDLHGEYLIVGAPYASNGVGLKTGQSYVYRQDQGGANSWGIKHTLSPFTAQAEMAFGFSVGIWDSNLGAADSASRSVIGAPMTDNSGFADVGSVNFFNDGTSNFTHTHTANANNVGAHLGYSVAIEDTGAIAGRPSQTVSSQAHAGQVDTFFYNGTIWAPNTINLTQTGAQAGYYYGNSVDLSGTVAVVGAPSSREDALTVPPGAIRAGIVETLEKPGATWTKDTDSYVRAVFDQPNTAADQYFGFDVDMTNEWLAVGAQQDGQKGVGAGAVYMYRNVSGVWTPHSKLTALYGKTGDQFGTSVAINGTRLIVGAPGFDGFPAASSNAGAVYSFLFNGTHWVQSIEVTSPNPIVDGRFGFSVDYHGDVVVVGANGEDGNKGRAYAYRDLTTFTSPLTLNIAAASVGSSTGNAVSVYDPIPGTPNNEVIAIGAYNENGSQGAAYVLSGATFSTITTLVDPSPGANRFFGYDVSIHNGRVAVGAPTNTAAPSGRVVVFSGSGYATAETLTRPTGAGQFGFSLNLESNSLVVGSPATAGRAGTAHVFGFSAGTWAEQGPLQPSDLATFDEYGSSITQFNGSYVVGAPLHNANSISNSGAAYAFSLAPEVTVDPTTLSVAEEGETTDSFLVSLNQTPATDVTIELTFDTQVEVDTGSGFGASPQTVTLTPANALTGVTVSVRAVDDSIDEADTHSTTITTSVTASSTTRFNGLEVDDVTVDIADNDTAGVTIDQDDGITVTESGTTDSYTIVLDTRPTSTVNVAIAFPAADLTVNGDTDGTFNTTFTTSNWNNPQNITVAAVNDRALEGDHSGTLVHAFTSVDSNYDSITAEVDGTTSTNDLTVNITDNESAVLAWVPTTASADEGTDNLTAVRLDITADPVGGTPTLEGTISYTLNQTLVTAEAADLGTITGSLSFTNVSDLASNAITIPHLTDALVEGEETYTYEIVSGTLPAGMNVTVSATDFTGTINDVNTATVMLSGDATVAESVGTTPLTVFLNIPGGGTLSDAVTVAVDLSDGTATYAAGAGDYAFTGPANTVNVTFPAGSSDGDSEVVDVNITEDVLVEGTETLVAGLGAVTGEATVDGMAQSITITDNESATVSFVSSSSNAPEGTTPHIVQTILEITSVGTGTPALQNAVTVAVVQTPDTAATPADYTLTSPSITFSAGSVDEALLFINITIVNDATAEIDETFDLSFGAVTGAATASGTHEVTIVDNDEPGVTITQTASSTDVDEGGSTDNYTIVLNTQPTNTVNLAITFPGTDLTVNGDTDGTYNTTFTTVNWNLPQTITVGAVNDRNFEADHSGNLVHTFTSADTLYNGITALVDGTDSTNTITVDITDNETLELRWENATGSDTEGATYIANVVMDITSDPAGGTPQNEVAISFEAPITYITAEAADIQIQFISQTINVGNNDGQQYSVFHDFLVDALVEGDETFSMAIDVTTPYPGLTVGTDHTATILEGSTVTASIATTSLTRGEDIGTFNIPVTLNVSPNAALSDPATVVVELNDNTAIFNGATGDMYFDDGGTPADSIIVTFPAGSDNGDVVNAVITLVDDQTVERSPASPAPFNVNEQFSVTLGATTGVLSAATGTTTVAIDENDFAYITVNSPSSTVDENDGTITRNLRVRMVTVGTGPQQLQDSATVPLENLTYGSAAAPDDYTVITTNVTIPAGALNDSLHPFQVSIVDDDIDESNEFGDVSIVNGSYSGVPIIVPFSANNDCDTSVNPGLTPPNPCRNRMTIQITDNDTAGITVTESGATTEVAEGGANDSYTVVLTSEPSADVTINIAFDAAQIIVGGESDGTLALTFTPANWDTAQTVNVVAVDDTSIETDPHTSPITQSASSSDALYDAIDPADVSVSITENDFQDITFSATTSSVNETTALHTVTARLSLISNGTPGGTISADMTANVNVTLGSAEAADFTLGTLSVTFPAGSAHNSTLPVEITIANDLLLEGDETFVLSYTLVTSLGTASGTHTVTITDDETAVIAFNSANGATNEGVGSANIPARLTISGSGTGNARLESAASVTVIQTPGTAVSPADYSVPSANLTFAAGVNSPVTSPVGIDIVNDVLVENDETFTLSFGTVTGPASITASGTHVVTIVENDSATITFATPSGLIAEAAGTYTANALLSLTTNGTGTAGLQDAQVVGITQTGVTATNVTDYDLTTASVTFTPADANGATKAISVTIVSDAIDENDETFELDMTPDPASVATISETSHVVTITDDDSASVTVTESTGTTAVTEGGATDTYSVVLTSAPTADVTIDITFDSTQISVDSDTDGVYSLLFTTGDWNTAQTVTVEAVNDTVVEGAHSALITQTAASSDTNYNNIATADVNVSITDNDTAEVIFSGAGFSALEGANFSSGMTLKVTANGAPGGSIAAAIVVDMTLTLGTAEASDVTITTAQATFPAGSVHDTVVSTHAVTVTDDLVVERTEDFTLNLSINSGLATTTASNIYQILSDDTAVISYVAPTSNAPEAATPHSINAQITLGGAGTGTPSIEEAISVIVTEAAGTATTPVDYTLTTTSISFPAGATNGTTASVSSAIVNDMLIEGAHTFTLGFGAITTDLTGVSASGTNVVTIFDDDFAGVTIVESGGSTDVTEGIGSDTFTLALNAEPTSDVTITFDVGIQVTFAPNPLVISAANWNVPQTVTVTAVDDIIIEGNHSATVGLIFTGDANFAAITPNSIAVGVDIIDNDVPGITVTQSGGTTVVAEGGITDTYDIVLLGAPSQDVTITLNGGTQVTAAPNILTFTPANYNIAQTVTVTAINDFIYEGAHTGTITHTVTSADTNYNGFAVPSLSVSIIDGVSEMITNGSFEIAGAVPREAQGWSNTDLTNKDRRLCLSMDASVLTVDGSCVFQFRFSGPTNALRVIKQRFNNPAWGDAGDTLVISAQVNATNLTTGARAFVKVFYTDNTSARAVAAIPSGTYGYTPISATLDVTKRIKKVIVKIRGGQALGRLWIDDVSLLYTPGDGVIRNTADETRGGLNTDVLPLPPPPPGWRN